MKDELKMLRVRIPCHLYKVFKSLAALRGISMTQMLIEYLVKLKENEGP
jgi:chromosome condensin MukBEF MukE localization factor